MTETITADDLLGLGLSPRTAYIYARALDRVTSELEAAGSDLRRCGPVEVARIAQGWTMSHSSRCQLRGALARAWELLGREDGPLRAVPVPPKPRARCKALEADDAARLERAAWARGDNPGLAVLIGLYAGLRRAEIARVRYDDFATDAKGRLEWLRVAGKGGLVADVPVHPNLARAIGARACRVGWVFPGKHGPVCPATIWAWVKEVGSGAGVELYTHVLRHTALAEANDRSGDLRTVQAFARHARPETTAGYTRVRTARLKEVVSMIDYGRKVA